MIANPVVGMRVVWDGYLGTIVYHQRGQCIVKFDTYRLLDRFDEITLAINLLDDVNSLPPEEQETLRKMQARDEDQKQRRIHADKYL